MLQCGTIRLCLVNISGEKFGSYCWNIARKYFTCEVNKKRGFKGSDHGHDTLEFGYFIRLNLVVS